MTDLQNFLIMLSGTSISFTKSIAEHNLIKTTEISIDTDDRGSKTTFNFDRTGKLLNVKSN